MGPPFMAMDCEHPGPFNTPAHTHPFPTPYTMSQEIVRVIHPEFIGTPAQWSAGQVQVLVPVTELTRGLNADDLDLSQVTPVKAAVVGVHQSATPINHAIDMTLPGFEAARMSHGYAEQLLEPMVYGPNTLSAHRDDTSAMVFKSPMKGKSSIATDTPVYAYVKSAMPGALDGLPGRRDEEDYYSDEEDDYDRNPATSVVHVDTAIVNRAVEALHAAHEAKLQRPNLAAFVIKARRADTHAAPVGASAASRAKGGKRSYDSKRLAAQKTTSFMPVIALKYTVAKKPHAIAASTPYDAEYSAEEAAEYYDEEDCE